MKARITSVLALLLLGGCTTTSYYLQLARGQYELLSRREPISRVVQDPGRDTRLRQRLASLQEARVYATAQLHLPDNGSYTQYSDLRRDYVVWNVFATPAYSLDGVESCFPIAGCVLYRGYFHQADAERQAAALAARGLDTDVDGSLAYSTLGWFDDPVLNTMMRWSDAHLVGTLFHELSHQRLYVKSDTAFNESFANFVEQQGLHDYYQSKGLDSGDEAQRERRGRQFVELVLATRARLVAAYAASNDEAVLREAKQSAFDDLRRDYRQLRDTQWNGYAGYDAWFDEPLNNARLLPFGLYDQWVPAFAALWRQQNRDWPAFYKAAAAMGKLDPKARLARLQTLAGSPADDGR